MCRKIFQISMFFLNFCIHQIALWWRYSILICWRMECCFCGGVGEHSQIAETRERGCPSDAPPHRPQHRSRAGILRQRQPASAALQDGRRSAHWARLEALLRSDVRRRQLPARQLHRASRHQRRQVPPRRTRSRQTQQLRNGDAVRRRRLIFHIQTGNCIQFRHNNNHNHNTQDDIYSAIIYGASHMWENSLLVLWAKVGQRQVAANS